MEAGITKDATQVPPVATGLSQPPGTSRTPGRLILAAVPIGMPQDASFRLAAALSAAPLIAAEDTRRLRRLPRSLNIGLTGRVTSYSEELEAPRGPLTELAHWAERGVLGEITLVVGGAPIRSGGHSPDAPPDAAAHVAAAEQAGSTRKEAITLVAAELGLPRREVYDAVIKAKRLPP